MRTFTVGRGSQSSGSRPCGSRLIRRSGIAVVINSVPLDLRLSGIHVRIVIITVQLRKWTGGTGRITIVVAVIVNTLAGANRSALAGRVTATGIIRIRGIAQIVAGIGPFIAAVISTTVSIVAVYSCTALAGAGGLIRG